MWSVILLHHYFFIRNHDLFLGIVVTEPLKIQLVLHSHLINVIEAVRRLSLHVFHWLYNLLFTNTLNILRLYRKIWAKVITPQIIFTTNYLPLPFLNNIKSVFTDRRN